MMFQDMINKLYPSVEMQTKTITLAVIEWCNLKCSYCYEVHKTNKVMSVETGERAIDRMFEEYEDGSGYISPENSMAIILEFIGGEPFLAIDLIDHLTDYFKKKAIRLRHVWAMNYMISITTNGTLYFDERVQDYINKNKNNLSLTITIDGNKKLHDACRIFHDGSGSYDLVERAVKHQIAHSGDISTKLTLAPENIEYLVDAIKNLRLLGMSGVHGNCVFEEGWNIGHAKIFYEKLKELADWLLEDDLYKDFACSLFDEILGRPQNEFENQNWCGGTGKMLAVDVDGNLYPCLRYMPFTLQNNREPVIIGDIVNGIEVTEKQKAIVTEIKEITRRSQSTDECFNCPISSGCAWCSAYHYDLFGTANKRATFICVMHKARVLANVYYWNKLYKLNNLEIKFMNHVPSQWALEIVSAPELEMINKMTV